MFTATKRSHLLIAAAAAVIGIAPTSRADDKVTYQDHILPLFRNSCLNCHNPDKKKAGLDLSTYAGAMAGGGTGKAIEPGDPDGSLLFRLVKHDEEPNMPPKSDKLPDKDLDLIKRWIAGGVLESSGSTAVASSKPKLDLTVQVSGKGKPAGEPVMPGDLLLEPTIHTARTGAVLAMASSPWAPLVAVGGQKQVLLYNSKSLELLGVLPFPEGFPNVLRFSRSGKLLLVAGGVGAKSGKAVLFDVSTGNRVTEVGDELDSVLAADISPDQTTVALGGPSKVVKLFSTANGAMTAKIKKHTDWVTAVAFSPDGKLLATGDRNGGLFVWEAETANEVHNLPGHKAAVTSLRFRGDGNLLASSGEDGRLVLWNMADGKPVKEIKANQPGVLSLDFAPDGRLVTAGRDNLLRTWKPDGAALKSFPKFNDVALHAVFDQSDGGTRVIGADWTGAVRVFDAEKPDKAIGTLDPNPPVIAERVAKLAGEVSERQAACDKVAMPFFQAEEALARATIARKAAEGTIANAPKIQAEAEARLAAATKSLETAEASFASAKSVASEKRAAADKALQAAIQAKSAQDAANAEYETLSTDPAAMREETQRALGEKSKQLSTLGDATAKALESAAAATTDRSAAQRSLDDARKAIDSAKHALDGAKESIGQTRRAKLQATQALAESSQQIKHLSGDLEKLKPGVAQANAALSESKQALARLKAGEFFTQVYAARQELATRKAEFEAADAQAKAAKAAADKAVADVPAFERRTTEFPQRISAAERAIPVAERLAAVAANVAKGLVEIKAERETFLAETASRADKLAEMSAAAPENKLLADAAAAARNTADLLAKELETFKAGIKTQDRAVKDAADAVVAARANLAKERSDQKNAPQILASLRAAVAPAQAAAAEKAALADAASKHLANAKSKSEQLELRYAELKKQLGLPPVGSPTSTASAR
jgi:WD40 repeat protein